MLELNKFHDRLTREYVEKIELHEVLSKSRNFFDAVPHLGGGRDSVVKTRLLDEDFGMADDGRGAAHAGTGRDGDDMRFNR